MTTNVGGIDRILRILVGFVLIACWFLFPDAAYRWIFLIGIVPLLTGIFEFCPVYTLLGMNTCQRKK